jgi:hypothetical protein
MPSGAAPSGGAGGADGGGNITDFGASVANASHLSNLTVDPWTTDVNSIVYGNSSCILNPEGEIGPYCTVPCPPFDQTSHAADKGFSDVQGEFVRHDITETQPGVPVYLEEQFINVNTCEPITGLYSDIWQ